MCNEDAALNINLLLALPHLFLPLPKNLNKSTEKFLAVFLRLSHPYRECHTPALRVFQLTEAGRGGEMLV